MAGDTVDVVLAVDGGGGGAVVASCGAASRTVDSTKHAVKLGFDVLPARIDRAFPDQPSPSGTRVISVSACVTCPPAALLALPAR